jgi:hypothetical protein
MVNKKGLRKEFVAYFKEVSDICLEHVSRISGAASEIRTEYLAIIGHESYRYFNPPNFKLSLMLK